METKHEDDEEGRPERRSGPPRPRDGSLNDLRSGLSIDAPSSESERERRDHHASLARHVGADHSKELPHVLGGGDVESVLSPAGSAEPGSLELAVLLEVLLDEAEPTLLVVLVQLETQVVQQLDRCLATVLICKVAHRVTKQILKAVAVAVAVTTAVAVVPIKLQVVDQKMVAVVAVPAT